MIDDMDKTDLITTIDYNTDQPKKDYLQFHKMITDVGQNRSDHNN